MPTFEPVYPNTPYFICFPGPTLRKDMASHVGLETQTKTRSMVAAVQRTRPGIMVRMREGSKKESSEADLE
jgi:hypothetical protein